MEIRVLKSLCGFVMCSHIKYRFFEESVSFVHYSVQESRLCFWYFSREFDCRMEAVCLQEKFFNFVPVCGPQWYDVINKSKWWVLCYFVSIFHVLFSPWKYWQKLQPFSFPSQLNIVGSLVSVLVNRYTRAVPKSKPFLIPKDSSSPHYTVLKNTVSLGRLQ